MGSRDQRDPPPYAARHGRDSGVVAVTVGRDGEGLVVCVDDDGAGVAPGERERVFERFARGSEARTAGSGLGLALVRQQARLHGGEVTVSDGQLGGACFTVRLSAGGDGPPADDRTTG